MSGPKRKLTYKQELFCKAYVGEAKGNATEAARIAGYKSPRMQGSENLAKPYLLSEIQRLTEEAQKARGALTPEEIHQLWGSIARDENESTANRLTALRDAARASGQFLDRIEHSTASAADVRALLGLGDSDDE